MNDYSSWDPIIIDNKTVLWGYGKLLKTGSLDNVIREFPSD